MDGAVAIAVGALLCFAGVASVHLGVVLSGFGVSWMVADALGASSSVAVIIGIAGAGAAWVIVSLIFRAAMLFVGGVTGAVIGAKLYSVLESDRNLVVALVFTAAIALLSAVVANRWRVRALLWLTAVGGAGLLLNGVGRAVGSLDAVRRPLDAGQRGVAGVLWVVVALLGWLAQRRVSARALNRDRART